MTRNPDILLVDDEQCDFELFKRATLKCNSDLQVASARDGLEALEYLATISDDNLPKLLVVDFKMPRMGGVQLLEELQKIPRLRYLPVVVLTSSTDRNDISGAYAAGASAYLVKPVIFSEFEKQVTSLLCFWLQYNQLVT